MKTITVQESTWKRLTELKLEKKFKSIDLIILELINKYK
jgi:predicted CopG family antitoxin